MEHRYVALYAPSPGPRGHILSSGWCSRSLSEFSQILLRRKAQKQMKVRFTDEDEQQIVDPQIASDFLVNEAWPKHNQAAQVAAC